MTTESEPELTDTQKAYNVAQSNLFQLAAYGHCTYTPRAELLTAEGKAEQADYNNRIRKAREELEAAVLRLVAEHAETFRGDWGVPAAWLRSLADDPAELSLLAVRPDERETDASAAPVAAPPTGQTGLRELIAEALLARIKRATISKTQPYDGLTSLLAANEFDLADAVLSVLPADSEPHRLALSESLGLGTSAPWDAIRERAAELQAEVASLTEASRRLLEQRQEMAEERYAWQERGDRAEARVRALEAGQAALSDADRKFLTFALDLAADQMASRGDEFDADDEDAMERLRRVADEAQRLECALCGHRTCMLGKPCGVIATEQGDLAERCGCTGGGTPQPETQPQRGDAFEQWLKAQRDAAADYPEAYQTTDGLLDLYRLHADMGVPLGGHVCEGRAVGDCECLEKPAVTLPGKEA